MLESASNYHSQLHVDVFFPGHTSISELSFNPSELKEKHPNTSNHNTHQRKRNRHRDMYIEQKGA